MQDSSSEEEMLASLAAPSAAPEPKPDPAPQDFLGEKRNSDFEDGAEEEVDSDTEGCDPVIGELMVLCLAWRGSQFCDMY